MRDRTLPLGCLVALVALAAACGGDDKGPTQVQIDPIVGSYHLRINGQMPFTFRPDSFFDGMDTLIYRETWVRDEYTLSANHRFSDVFKVRSIDTSTAGGAGVRDSLDATVLGRWERATLQGQAVVRLIADSLVEFGVRTPFPEPDTQYIPLPTATGWSFNFPYGHASLGPVNPVVVQYSIAYVKQ